MAQTDWNGISEFRFQKKSMILALVESLCDESLSLVEKRRLREDFMAEHGVVERTIRNYLTTYRRHGAAAFLKPVTDKRSPRIHDEALAAKIVALVKERPNRTVPQLRRLIRKDEALASSIARVSNRTVYRFLDEHGLSWMRRRALCADVERLSFHRFQASHPLELVQGDARDGIWIDTQGTRRKTYLFLWLDDYSRKILAGRYYFDEKLPRMEDSFKRMVLRWGIPEKLYLDNGSVYIARQFAWILSELGSRKIHHKPYQAYCKGKIEALNKTVLGEFQAEAARAGFATIEELNSAFSAWVDLEYNVRVHSSTGETPDMRFHAALPKNTRRVTDIAWFEALFLMRVTRTVTKYGKIKLEANEYPVTSAPHGSVIEVRYDPFNLREVCVYKDGTLVETTSVSKLVSRTAAVPEESAKNKHEISAESIRYFEKLRAQHALHQKENLSSIAFAKLKEEQQ